MAVRVVSARRAFSLLLRNLAEVVSVEDAGYISYDMASWLELSQLRAQFERENHDFVKTVRFEIAVPRIVRLLSYDRLPRQDVKLNRRNIYARDHSLCQYCGKKFPTQELSLDARMVPRSLGEDDVGQSGLCVRVLQCEEKVGGRRTRHICI